MKVNQATVDLVKRFEGLRLKSYRDPVGIWTVGYGTTSSAGIGVSVGAGMEISEETAEKYLMDTLNKFGEQILSAFTRKPTDNQYGAMLSLAYNIGVGAFKKSTCLRRFNAGDEDGAAEALTWFNKAGGKVLRGLVRRREAERELFMADNLVEAITPPADPERSPAGSSTLQATAATAVAGCGAAGTAIGALDGTAQIILIVLCFIAACGLAWIAKERIRKWADGDR